MKSAFIFALCGLGLSTAQAAPWAFDESVTVAAPAVGVFHHVESAGRRNIAVADGNVAIAWEDNRDGTSRAYAALFSRSEKKWTGYQLSAAKEAFEPVVIALADGRFLFGWEEAGQVWVRSGGVGGLDPATRLSGDDAQQLTLGAGGMGTFAIWTEKRKGEMFTTLRATRLHVGKSGAAIVSELPAIVDPSARHDQLYPAIAVLKSSAVLAWEDRRFGHTVILHSRTTDGNRFSTPQQLNEQLAARSQTYGRGTGVARVVLATADGDRVAAAWLDKRDFLGGYDVYAAASEPGGARFGKNEVVQDDFGANIGQWNASLAVLPGGRQVIVWDDNRDGSPDLWLSWNDGTGWSANLAVPGANGPGEDTSASITAGDDGSLHIVWVQRDRADGPTRIQYVRTRPPSAPVH